MAFDARAGLLALEALLQTFDQIQRVYIGRPKAPEHRLCACITLGQHEPVRYATKQVSRDGACLVTLFYRVGETDERAAELAIAELVDAFPLAIYRDPTLGGICTTAVVDTSLANDARYLLWSGQDYREYPLLVAMRQYDSAA